MDAMPHGHPWSEDLYIAKAKLYIDQMIQADPDDWSCALWSALALEFILRAALSHVSPALLANTPSNGSGWRNVHYAVKKDYTGKGVPTSIGTGEVIERLKALLPEFNKEVYQFCRKHISKRNHELHTGDMAFSDSESKRWQPQFYRACSVLLGSIGSDLGCLLPEAKVDAAQQMIDGLHEAARIAVKDEIAEHKLNWDKRPTRERRRAQQDADKWATRDRGHRVACPSCDSTALIFGDASGPVQRSLDANEVVVKQRMWPKAFECQACGLRISGFSKLSACNLGGEYTVTRRFPPGAYFGLYAEDDFAIALEEGWRDLEDELYRDDFNEY